MRRHVRLLRLWLGVTLAGVVLLPGAAADALAQREARLASTLRCMVCQNQTLAESNAPLAASMRGQILEQLRQGRSDDEIRDYFEQRYGAFVRYDPPFTAATWLLWLAPFALLAAGLAMLWRTVTAHRRQAQAPLTAQERERAAALLLEEDAR